MRTCVNPACSTRFEPLHPAHLWCGRMCMVSDFEAWRLTQDDYIPKTAIGMPPLGLMGDLKVICRFDRDARARV